MAHKHVLDTHALIWYLEGNPRLGAQAKAIIDDPDSELVLPIIALAEASFIIERGRTSIPDVNSLLAKIQADPRIEICPLDWNVFRASLAATTVPEMHDRQIVGTALNLDKSGHTVDILTKDRTIIDAGLVVVVW